MPHTNFAEIILPLSLEGTFTYHLTQEERNDLVVGQRVSVPFGARKIYTGIVHSFHSNKPELFKTKGIHAILDEFPLITKEQIKFWEWIADYYLCTLGDVFRNAFPSALKLESETFIRLVEKDAEDEELTDKEELILEVLWQRGIISISEAADIIEQKSAISVAKSLWEKGFIRLDERLFEKYTPKIQNYVRVKESLLNNESDFNLAVESLKNAPKQKEILLSLISEQIQTKKPIKVSEFLKSKSVTHSVLNSLQEKDLVEIYQLQTSRVDKEEVSTQKIPELTKAQKEALSQIKENFKNEKPTLLHGVASGGKTEIYLQLIEENLNNQKKALLLLPEISLTTQLVRRVQKYFGNRVGVYHSKFSQNERVELWEKTLRGEYDIVLGPRSALFLPFTNLGLIIVDEEHDSTYKQTDNKPYFQARDMALVLANQLKSNILLASATPSLETYHNAKSNKFGYVNLSERYGNSQLPEIELIDLKTSLKRKEISGEISHILRDAIAESLESKKQVIIFQNRRGFAPILECEDCGFVPECPNCDISLTYHKSSNQLKCHYCGHSQARIKVCLSCHSSKLDTKGIGTEQIEIQLNALFPKAKIARMDVDAMRKKHAYEKLIEAFEQREIDILVGTQMVTKGLDFGNVNLVGVIRADSLLNYPDFRAHEKAFQLLTQVAGRAGRREDKGKVLIQSFNPEHQVLQNVTTYDYEKNSKEILYERKNFIYPPFSRLIKITFKHGKKERVDKTAKQFVDLLKPILDKSHLLGPEEPPVSRIRNQYITNVLIKIESPMSIRKIKNQIKKSLESLNSISVFRSVKIDVDVDP